MTDGGRPLTDLERLIGVWENPTLPGDPCPSCHGYFPNLPPTPAPASAYQPPKPEGFVEWKPARKPRVDAPKPNHESLTGRTFGLITVGEIVSRGSRGVRYAWQCKCGTTGADPESTILDGTRRTCGKPGCRRQARALVALDDAGAAQAGESGASGVGAEDRGDVAGGDDAALDGARDTEGLP